VYSREIDGQVTTFGVSGKLIMNVLVMYDRQTESLWSQLLGEAVQGEHKGTRLEFLPSMLTTWEDWKARYPDTLALVRGVAGDYDPYDSCYASGQAGVLGEERRDDRLQTKEFVVGVALGDEAVAYPWSVLSSEPVVNDKVGGTPVLVVFDANTQASVAYAREVDRQVLTFALSDPSAMHLTDAETGSRWDGMTGLALEGPLAGKSLNRVRSTSSFWFGWKDWYPETRVYGAEG
jgi:hypothetical protein